MTKLNKEAFEKLTKQNLKWLKEQPITLERDHIEHILEWSVGQLYPKQVKSALAPVSQQRELLIAYLEFEYGKNVDKDWINDKVNNFLKSN